VSRGRAPPVALPRRPALRDGGLWRYPLPRVAASVLWLLTYFASGSQASPQWRRARSIVGVVVLELASRLPARLSPGQTVVVAIIAAAVLVALLARSLFEAAFIGLVGLILRLTGHRPPRRSSFSTVLDDFEARSKRRDGGGD
jgi:hypothetical protein